MSTLGQQQTFRDVCATVCFAPISGHLPARVTRRLWANKRHSFVWFWDNSWLFFLTVDPPSLKWSDLKYVIGIKEDRYAEEALQA
jgi:hypothetical protein